MQHFIKQRATETADISFETPAVDVIGMPLLTHELIVYSLAGTSPQIQATLETSSDLETWTNVSGISALDVTAAGADVGAVLASSAPYSRYVRYRIEVSGTTTSICYSLVLNTFASS